MFKKTTMEELRVKSQQLNAYLELIIDELLKRLHAETISKNTNSTKGVPIPGKYFSKLI